MYIGYVAITFLHRHVSLPLMPKVAQVAQNKNSYNSSENVSNS